MRGVCVALAIFPLAGCGTIDFSKLTNASAKATTSGIQLQLNHDQTLITELQAEDEGLRFLSHGKLQLWRSPLTAKSCRQGSGQGRQEPVGEPEIYKCLYCRRKLSRGAFRDRR